MSTEALLNRLARWRMVLTGWQLGTRSKEDPEAQAVRDHREATLLLRAELTALTVLLMKKNVFTKDEYDRQLSEEAKFLMMYLEERFPGFKTDDTGVVMTMPDAAETIKGWRA